MVLDECVLPPLMAEWNQSETDYGADLCLHRAFDEQAQAAPRAIAVQCGDDEVTYQEVQRRSDAISVLLTQHGVRAGEHVGILIERSVDVVCAILGVLKAGAVYVPVEPTFPLERLRVLLEDAEVRVLLTLEHLCERVAGLSVETVALNVATLTGEAGPATVEAAGTPDSIACLMYTSGSTGAPKGIMITHRGIVRLVRNTNYIEFTPADRVAQSSSIAFDGSHVEIWGALLHGATLVIVPRDVLISPQFPWFLVEQGITVLFLTTTVFNFVVDTAPGALQRIPQVLFGGERASLQHVRRLLAAGAPERLTNGYGPTEVTTFGVAFEVHGLRPDATSVPIGRPISNTTAYVLDEQMRPLPPGAVGELYIGGPGVGQGYWKNPELSAQRFLESPFKAGERIYRTGDLARYDEDGLIDCLGRIDNQIKIRGFRIEPEEIEEALRRIDGVTDAAVMVRGEGAHRAMIGFVTGSAETLHPNGIRAQLRTLVPDYMVPARIAVLPQLPIASTGKVDRAALAAMEPIRPKEYNRDGTPVLTPDERRLARIWAAELEIEEREIGPTDDFFDLGGDSLQVATVITAIEQETGTTLSVAQFYASSTLQMMALCLHSPPEDRKTQRVVAHRVEGDRPTLYMLCQVRAQLPHMRRLTRMLPANQPCYSLLIPQVDEIDTALAPATLKEMAAAMVEELRAHQPYGPYRLFGHCFTGMVAYEMAHQIEEAGDRVDLVLASECYVEDTRLAAAFGIVEPLLRAARISSVDLSRYRLRWGRWREQTAARVRNLFDRPRGASAAGRPAVTVPQSNARDADPSTVWHGYLAALYRFPVYHGHVCVAFADTPHRPGDCVTPWRLRAPHTRFLRVEGTHNTVLTTHLQSLGASLRSALEERDGPA